MLISVVGLLIAMFSLHYKVSQDAKKDLVKAIEEGDKKREVIWKRIDENRVNQELGIDKLRNEREDNYVPNKICNIIHSNTDQTLAKMERSLEAIVIELKFLRELKTGG